MLIDRTEELKLFDDNDMTNGRDVDRRACVIDRLANRTDADAMVKGEDRGVMLRLSLGGDH